MNHTLMNINPKDVQELTQHLKHNPSGNSEEYAHADVDKSCCWLPT